MNLQNKIRFSFLLIILILFSSGFSSYHAITNLIKSAIWVAHTHKVTAKVHRILINLKSAESGQRGYLLTNELTYLQPYTSSIKKIHNILNETKTLTQDNPHQQIFIIQLELLINKKLTELEKTIELTRTGNRAAALELVLTHHGKVLMDEIQAIYNAMHTEEKRLLVGRQQVSTSAVTLATSISLFGGIIVFFLIGFIILIIIRESEKHIIQQERTTLKLECLLHDREERLKELQCIYSVTKASKFHTNFDDYFREVTSIIQYGWQYPAITRGKITFKGKEYVSEPFKETKWKQSSDIIVDNRPVGSIEIYYLEECPKSDEGPFMTEERNLLNNVAVNLSDVIYLKQKEKQLEHSEDRFRKFFELSLIGMAMTSVDKKWIEFNDTICQIFGYSREELSRMSWEELTYPEDLNADITQFNRILAGEIDSYAIDKRFYHKDKSIIFASLSVNSVRKNDGSLDYLVAHLSDNTEHRKLEKQLIQSQKMEAIGLLTGGIAHDFNNILNIILTNTELMKQSLANNEAALKRARNIEHTTQRAANLTRQLLSFSQQREGSLEAVNINQLLNEMSDMISSSITPQIEVEMHLDKELWMTRIDPSNFKDVLLNLVINARDAMAGKGKLTIKTSNLTMEKCEFHRGLNIEPGNYIQLSVTDSGTGIAKGLLDKLFDPFFTTKEPGQGTGLGLSLTYGFIKRSGGIISVESNINLGTTFIIKLPQTREAIAPLNKKNISLEEHPHGSETILVVDDEVFLLDLTREALESLGYRVLTANNAQQALEILAKEPGIELLFSDVVMPGLNGYELAEKATELYPHLKVLLCSGYTEKTSTSNKQKEHFDKNLIKKPFKLFELAQKIRAIFKKIH